MIDHPAGGLARVVPPLETRDGHRRGERMIGVDIAELHDVPPPQAENRLRIQPIESELMSTLRAAFAGRVVVADGAIGTMLQASTATLDDFAGHEGCNE